MKTVHLIVIVSVTRTETLHSVHAVYIVSVKVENT